MKKRKNNKKLKKKRIRNTRKKRGNNNHKQKGDNKMKNETITKEQKGDNKMSKKRKKTSNSSGRRPFEEFLDLVSIIEECLCDNEDDRIDFHMEMIDEIDKKMNEEMN